MPYIKEEIVNQILERTITIDVLQDFTTLTKKGSQMMGLSPFGSENTGSFSYKKSKDIWKDFSSGKGGVGAVSFLMEKESLTYPEALEWLANKYSITVEYDTTYDTKEFKEKEQKKQDLRPVLASSIRVFQEALSALPATHPAMIELYDHRGYTDDIVKMYGIGYAPGKKTIYNNCYNSGRVADAIELGLVNENNNDKWANRVIYPFNEIKGGVKQSIGLAGRRLDDNNKFPKWINSKDSVIYDKSSFWYGLDFARATIIQKGEAWIVEGYNDVIGWQTNGILNTIASCGTAIAAGQIKQLRKICDKVVLCFDTDIAGKKAMLRYIPEFIKNGFRVQLFFTSIRKTITEKRELATYIKKKKITGVTQVSFAPDLDPDDFIRYYTIGNKKPDLSIGCDDSNIREDGFKFLMQERFIGKDELEVAKEVQGICEIIREVQDEGHATIYKKWLQAESKISATQITKWITPPASKKKTTVKKQTDLQLPLGMKMTPEIEESLNVYGFFQAKKRIWMRRGDPQSYWFEDVSNFEVTIIQHMQDEKFPKKLIRVENVRNEEKIFDVPSDVFISPQQFDKAMSDNGNYLWDGNRNDLQKIRAMLYDQMGVGSMITELGWRSEGFWVWNNGIVIPGQKELEINSHGIFKIDKTCYYVPSANSIYEFNESKFAPQKRLINMKGDVNFAKWASMVYKVHREIGMTSMIFALAAMHRDLIISKDVKMPLMFLYGPPGTGKDELIECCMRLYGHPQSALQIGSKLSTGKAQIRKFAQFKNILVHLSEYRPGDLKTNEMLKGLWDNLGYDYGTIESKYASDNIPISSSVFVTGNHYPDEDALISRIIPSEMKLTEFSAEQRTWFNDLKDINTSGVSHLTTELLHHRPHWEENFKPTYRRLFKELKQNIDFNVPLDRMIQNITVLLTCYKMLENKVTFPFSYGVLEKELIEQLERQCRRLKSASILTKFWECFLTAVHTLNEPLVHGREFEVKNGFLYFNMTHCYNKIVTKWYTQFHEMAPAKSKLAEELESSEGYDSYKKSHHMQHSNTSVLVYDLKQLPIMEDLQTAIAWRSQMTKYGDPPATPNQNSNDKSKSVQSDLDFPN